MPSLLTTLSASQHAAAGWLRRPLRASDVKALGVVFALVLIFTLSRTINGIFVSIRDHEVGDWLWLTASDLISHSAMAVVALLVVVPAVVFGPKAGWRRYVLLAAAVVVVAIACAVIRMEMLVFTETLKPQDWGRFPSRFLARFAIRYGFMVAMLLIVAEFYRHETRSLDGMHQAEVDRLTLDREMTEARLQVLQAQIEPHFLFNTLANVRRLYQTDLAGGRSMLEHLMRYLEVALPRMRDNTSSLAREETLIGAFLAVQKIRMGRRLEFALDFPAAIHQLSVPSMMLLTLVENAIKHGLNPMREGGRVDVSARVDDGVLAVTVSDTGRGFGEGTSGGGTGLANIRARLTAMYGQRAGLTLAVNEPTGIVATMVVPAVPFEEAA